MKSESTGHTVMGHTAPVSCACGDAVMDMNPDESVLILIKHCRDMKQQEARLRLITLLLLLSCTLLFVFTMWPELQQSINPGSRKQSSETEPNPAYAKQERECPADHAQPDVHRLRVGLISVFTKPANGKPMKWEPRFIEGNIQETRTIEIAKTGIYLVYMKIALICHQDYGQFKPLHVKLHRDSVGYNQTEVLTEVWDGVRCGTEGFRMVSAVELFDLLEGDRMSVWVEQGYELISKASFGASLQWI